MFHVKQWRAMAADDVAERASELYQAIESVKKTQDFPRGNPTPDEWNRIRDASDRLGEKLK